MNREQTIAQWINLFVPGGGLILLGQALLGWVVGLAFTALTAVALLATLLIPDEFSTTARNLCITGAAVIYATAQWALLRRGSSEVKRAELEQRAAALRAALEATRAGDIVNAWNSLRPIAHLAESDLLVALRVAQTLTALREPAAAQAWLRVKRLDRRHIYRAETTGALSALESIMRDPSS